MFIQTISKVYFIINYISDWCLWLACFRGTVSALFRVQKRENLNFFFIVRIFEVQLHFSVSSAT